MRGEDQEPVGLEQLEQLAQDPAALWVVEHVEHVVHRQHGTEATLNRGTHVGEVADAHVGQRVGRPAVRDHVLGDVDPLDLAAELDQVAENPPRAAPEVKHAARERFAVARQ